MNDLMQRQFKNAVSLPTGLWSRWWFGKGDQSYEAIYNDMKNSIVDPGVVRIEVAKGYVWTDSLENMAAFYYVLKAADQLGLRMDFATGTPYPAVIGEKPLVVDGKTYYDPAEMGYDPIKCNAFALKYAVKDVGTGLEDSPLLENVAAMVRRGFMGPAELTEGQTIAIDPAKGEKIAASAAHCLAKDGKTILASLDLSKSGFISPDGRCITVTAEQLSLAASYDGPGQWKVISYFTEFQPRNSVCYLNRHSTRVWIRWFQRGVIDNDDFWTQVMGLHRGEVRQLFDRVASGIWEDSLEAIALGYTDYALEVDGKNLDIFQAFKHLCGYELTPDRWAALFVKGNGLYSMGGGVMNDADFVLDPVADKRIRHDFFDVLTELYCRNHLQVYTDWAQAQPGRLDTRVQAAYLYAFDQDKAYHHVTIPEFESLNSSDRLDSNRAVAGAAHAAGLNVISSEMGARSISFTRETYSMAWYDWLWHCNNEFVSGINATVLHGIEYLYGRTANVWPGPCMAMPFAALAEPTGQRMPYFKLLKGTISTYLARAQYILNSGKPNIDVAIYYYYNELLNDYLDHFPDPELAKAGYCYEFLGDDSLRMAAPNCDGRALMPGKGGYRALVIDQYRSGNKPQCAAGPMAPEMKDFRGNGYMPLETARLIASLAYKGLPIVIVGKAPDKAAKAADNGGKATGTGDMEIRTIFEKLQNLKNVVLCETQAHVPEALKALGVEAASSFSGGETRDLYSFHRTHRDVQLYMLFNRSHTIHWKGEVCDGQMLQVEPDHRTNTAVTFMGTGVPYLMDCWTGSIYALPYTREPDGRVTVDVELEPSEAQFIAVAPKGTFTAEKLPVKGQLMSETAPQDWSLDLRLYRPAQNWLDDPQVSSAFSPDPSKGTMTTITYEGIYGIDPMKDGQLLPWKDLEALGEAPERSSGIGTYTAEFEVGQDFDPQASLVELSLEEATELFQVYINGQEVCFPQTAAFGSCQDITAAVKPGKNKLKIVVASGLWNSAKYYNTLAHEKNDKVVPQLSQETWISPDGLIGGVSVKVYERK